MHLKSKQEEMVSIPVEELRRLYKMIRLYQEKIDYLKQQQSQKTSHFLNH